MEVSDSVVLGVFGVCLVFYVTHSIKRIEVILLVHAEKISEINVPDLNIDGITTQIETLVEEMFENINLPTAGDMAMQMGLQFLANKFGLGPGSIPFVENETDEIEDDVDILQPPSS